MGMLWADENSDLLDIKSWHKSDKPVFKTSEENKQYGPGHNCFTTDNGKDVLIYHSRNYKEIKGDPLHDNNRHARAKVLNMMKTDFRYSVSLFRRTYKFITAQKSRALMALLFYEEKNEKIIVN